MEKIFIKIWTSKGVFCSISNGTKMVENIHSLFTYLMPKMLHNGAHGCLGLSKGPICCICDSYLNLLFFLVLHYQQRATKKICIINWSLFGLLHSQWLFFAMRKDHWECNEPIKLSRDQKASLGTC